jgi:CRP-like cAMP-binding protein
LIELAYQFKEVTFEAGSILNNVNDICQAMFVVRTGTIEILTQMDNGTDLVIELLCEGSSINANAFLVNDNLDVQARCATKTTLYMMHAEQFYNTIEQFPGIKDIITEHLHTLCGKHSN